MEKLRTLFYRIFLGQKERAAIWRAIWDGHTTSMLLKSHPNAMPLDMDFPESLFYNSFERKITAERRLVGFEKDGQKYFFQEFESQIKRLEKEAVPFTRDFIKIKD